ncbi:MAG: nickel-type superoxide dismutase maturation protease [Actinomycetales bacterium]
MTALQRLRAGAAQRRFGTVAVEGRSMLPAYVPGDWLLVRYGAEIRPGDVVLAARPDRPGLVILKRAVRATADGWWLLGDNASESDDSRLFGSVPTEAVLGRVLLRYRRGAGDRSGADRKGRSD